MDPKARRSFISVLFVAAMDNYGFGIVFAMFGTLILSPEYAFLPTATSDGMRNLYLGILFAAYPLTQLFGAPIIGDFADIKGRKTALNISILGSILGYIFSAWATAIYNLPFLIFSRLISGFFGGNLSVCLTSIADLSPSEQVRSRNFGILTVVWPLSWTAAMLTAGYLSTPQDGFPFFSPALPFWLTAFLFALAFLAIYFFYTETSVPDRTKKFNLIKGVHDIISAFTLKTIRPFFLVVLAWTLGWILSVEWYGAYSILRFDASQLDISWGLTIQGAFWLLGGLLVNPFLIKRLPSLKVALIGFCITGIFLLSAGFASALWLFNLLYFLAAIFSAFAFSNAMNLCSINAPERSQGTVMGITQAMMALGEIAVPVFGAVIGAKDSTWFYPIAGAFILIGFLILVARVRNGQKA